MGKEAESRLKQRQLALRLRSAELRAAIAEDVQALKPALVIGERGLQVWSWLQAVPRPLRLLPLAGVALLLRRPARLLRWSGRLLGALRWVRLLRELLR